MLQCNFLQQFRLRSPTRSGTEEHLCWFTWKWVEQEFQIFRKCKSDFHVSFHLAEVKVLVSKSLTDEKFRITEKNVTGEYVSVILLELDDKRFVTVRQKELHELTVQIFLDSSAVLPVRGTFNGKMSWTGKDVTFYLHEIDRSMVKLY